MTKKISEVVIYYKFIDVDIKVKGLKIVTRPLIRETPGAS